MTYVMPTPVVGDFVSDTINPANQTYGFQVISNVVTTVNATTKKNIYTLTVPSGTIVTDQDYLVLNLVKANGVQHWVMGSATNESTGE